MALNSKQLLFVKEYLVTRHATKAAKAAGYGPGDKTASVTGSRLLNNIEVQAEIKKADAITYKKIEQKAAKKGLTRERWLEELRLVAMANMDDYIEIREVEVPNGTEGEKSYIVSAVPILTKDRRRALGRVIKKISETRNGIGIELHNKLGALETLGKAYGWIKDAVDLNLPTDGIQVHLTMPSNGREALPGDEKDDELGGDPQP